MSIIKVGDKATTPSIRPSLLLDFANSKTLESRITYTRSSTATYYDGKTFVKAEENLYTPSSGSSPYQNTARLTKISSQTAPDGSSDAILVTQVAGETSGGYVGDVNFTYQQGNTYTVSCYVKANGTNFLRLVVHNNATASAFFNLGNGTVGTNSGFDSVSIQTIGSGWYRCIVVYTRSASTADGLALFYVAGADGSTTATPEVSSLYFWGPQIEVRSGATSYTPTTDQPITNYIPVLQTAGYNSPRFDHDPVTGESKGLLIEETKTNILPYSSTLSNWGSIGSQGSGKTIVPDGTLSGININRTAPNNAYSIVTASASTTYTYSVYVKAGFSSVVNFGVESGFGSYSVVGFNLSTGIAPSAPSGTSVSMIPVGNGWYRITMTGTTQSNTTTIILHIAVPTASYTNGVYVWGAQLEVGAFPTSYIPTAGYTGLRSSDLVSMTGTNFSSWYRQDEGTFYADGNLSNGSRYFHVVQSGGVNQIEGVQQNSTSEFFVYRDSAVQANIAISGNSKFLPHKLAGAYKLNDIAFSVDGSSVSTDTIAILPTPDTLLINSYASSGVLGSGTIKKLTYYPKRLADVELQELTQE